jgi:UbiD family decarboxylase
MTSPYVFTCDPETGTRNVGTYRVQVKSPRKLGIMVNYQQDAIRHIRKAEARGEPLPIAIVLGTDPTIGLCSVSNMPYGQDELAVAGGLRGEPIELVRGVTVPLDVPATAEIVVEGYIQPGAREWEGPFGEYPGYMGPPGNHPYIDITAITHRHNATYQAFVSQMPPSESSCIRGIGMENSLYTHLTQALGLPVTGVHFTESGGSSAYVVIKMKKEHEGQPKQAIWGAWGWDAGYGKITIVVDDDIDIEDSFQVEWALSFRTQPGNDVFIARDAPPVRLDPSLGSASLDQLAKHKLLGSKIAIDATTKHDYPALALPPREHLRLVEEHWEEYGFKA